MKKWASDSESVFPERLQHWVFYIRLSLLPTPHHFLSWRRFWLQIFYSRVLSPFFFFFLQNNGFKKNDLYHKILEKFSWQWGNGLWPPPSNSPYAWTSSFRASSLVQTPIPPNKIQLLLESPGSGFGFFLCRLAFPLRSCRHLESGLREESPHLTCFPSRMVSSLASPTGTHPA